MKSGQEIKRELAKVFGVKASSFSCSTKNGSYRVKVKSWSLSAEKVEKALSGYKVVHRCEATHEILGGGNTFVFVNYEAGELSAEHVAQVQAIQERYKDLDYFAQKHHGSKAVMGLEGFEHMSQSDASAVLNQVINQVARKRA